MSSVVANVPNQRERLNPFTLLLLATIVLLGFSLRVWNVNFDRGIGSHPDERSTACFYATGIKLPNTWNEFWDPKQSPLNPLWDVGRQERRSFTYGHFPLYVGVAVGEILHLTAPVASQLGIPDTAAALMKRADSACDAIAVAGRLAIALFDTITILLLFVLGRRIFGTGTGLLAAALYAFAAQAIQLSHFFAMDPASTTFTVLAVLGGVLMAQQRAIRSSVLTGVACGLAIASKFSALPVLAVPVVASVVVFWTERYGKTERADGIEQFRVLVGIPLAFALAALTFFVTSPYAILDWSSFIQATLVEQGRMVRGVADFPFTRQYRNTIPYLYFIEQQVRWGLWWPLGAIALAGTIYFLLELFVTVARMVGRVFLRNSWGIAVGPEQTSLLIVWAWVLPYFALTGAFLAKFNRYMSPVLPFAMLFAAGMIWRVWRTGYDAKTAIARNASDPPAETRSRRRGARIPSVAAVVLAVVALAGGLFWSLAYVNGVYGSEHTWITASRWIYDNAPRDSVILWELWDDPLPKTVPGEPGMDMGSTGLTNIDWSPYEEDTREKFDILKAKLRDADYVVYSSKRIYDSVDELPERYPMTNQYYEAMWDGSLGFELANEVTSPPRLFGMIFPDHSADESWSLYDHPQVSIFRKVRDLSDEEFDAIFDNSWENARHYYRGTDSPLSPFLKWIGLGNGVAEERSGLLGTLTAIFSGTDAEVTGSPEVGERPAQSLMLDKELGELAIVDDYRWNRIASERTWIAVVVWYGVLILLGFVVWPLCFVLFSRFRDRGFFLSRTIGWLLAGWLLWSGVSYGLLYNSVRSAWGAVGLIAIAGILVGFRQRSQIGHFLRANWYMLLAGETLFALFFGIFLAIRMANPDLWQPWFGGEKFMEMAFLNGILRSPEFPPVDPHFAGGHINYYYYGLYQAAFLVKLTGIYAEVAFNLMIPTLFAMTAINAFAVAYTAFPAQPSEGWRRGFGSALLAPFIVGVMGNLEGFGQLARNVTNENVVEPQTVFGLVRSVTAFVSGLVQALAAPGSLPAYDFWGPSRVIPNTINEFPYWSFLFADLHPHLIGIPIALVFLGLVYQLIADSGAKRHSSWIVRFSQLTSFAFLLGTLASVNLWELPTYFGLGLLAYAAVEFRFHGRLRWGHLLVISGLYLGGAFLFFRPFFRDYVNIGASGVGLVRAPDELVSWLSIWGFFCLVLVTWTFWTAAGGGRKAKNTDAMAYVSAKDYDEYSELPQQIPDKLPLVVSSRGYASGIERAITASFRHFERLPRLVYLHRLLVRRPTMGYLLGLTILPSSLILAAGSLLWGRSVLAFCLVMLGLSFLLVWRRDRRIDDGNHLATYLITVGWAILAGTQVVYLRDFLQGGDWYRMNTVFKFFSQVWVIWGVAAAIALPRIWSGFVMARIRRELPRQMTVSQYIRFTQHKVDIRDGSSSKMNFWFSSKIIPVMWAGACMLLIAASLTFVVFGTPARLSQRLVGWRPEFGTLNGLDYMENGTYTWPDENSRIELRHDAAAIRWLLDHVRGNVVLVESAEVDYYRAGGTRVATFTGLSGLRGMHESEQRYGDVVGDRDALHREFWTTTNDDRTLDLIDQLNIGLVYVGQLEQIVHPEGVEKMARLASDGYLVSIYQNDQVTIYAVPSQIVADGDGNYVPSAQYPDLG